MIEMKEVFGDCWWIKPLDNGKFALIKSQINVGDTSISDLTNEQLSEIDIEIFESRNEAEAERIKRVMSCLYP